MRPRLAALIATFLLCSSVARAGADDLPPVQAVAVGDFDGDGKPDVAVGLPELNAGKFKKAGLVRMYSGAKGTFIRPLLGSHDEESFGDGLAAVGDLDGDGATDLAIAVPFGEPPRIEIVSGRTGKRIRTMNAAGGGLVISWADQICPMGDGSGKAGVNLFVHWNQQKEWRTYYTDKDGTAGSASDDSALHSAAPVGDVDGDGKPDVAICQWSADVDGKKGAGLVRVVSGDLLLRGKADASLLTLKGDYASARMGFSVSSAGDWDGDGKGDVLAVVEGEDEKKGVWLVRVFSGKDGAVLWKASGAAGDWRVPGAALVGDADGDGDGKSDVAVATPAANSAAGIVQVLSAKDAAVIWSVKGAAKENFGDEIRAFPDYDADGVADLLVMSPGAAVKGTKGNGYVRVLSGKTGAVLLLLNPLAAK